MRIRIDRCASHGAGRGIGDSRMNCARTVIASATAIEESAPVPSRSQSEEGRSRCAAAGSRGGRRACGSSPDEPDGRAQQRQRCREEDAGLQSLQRPVVARWLVYDKKLQLARERIRTRGEGGAREPTRDLGGAGSGVSRQSLCKRWACAEEQLVQLRVADGSAGAIDDRG